MGRPVARYSILRRFMRFASSRSAILAAILLVTGLYVAGLLVPQRGRIDRATYEAWAEQSPVLVGLLESLGLTDVYRSELMVVALCVFFISLLAVIISRSARLMKRTRIDYGLPLSIPSVGRRRGVRSVETADVDVSLRWAEAVLSRRGYSVWCAKGGALRGVKFRFAPLGFLLFHGSFGLLLMGGVLLDLTRFSVTTSIAEGESFTGEAGPYTETPRRPRIGASYPDLGFKVVRITSVEEHGFPVSLSAELWLTGEMQPRRVEVNDPIVLGRIKVLLMNRGIAPLFVCETLDGGSDGAFVKLIPMGDRTSRFRFEPCDLEVLARPRASVGGGLDNERATDNMLSPDQAAAGAGTDTRIEVAIRRSDGEVTRGELDVGDEIRSADGAAVLRVERFRFFGDFQIVSEVGGGLLWAAFILGLVGLVLRLLTYRREIVVVPDRIRGCLLLAATADGVGFDRQNDVMDELASVTSA